MDKVVLLVGPMEQSHRHSYGSGAGGYIANMNNYSSLKILGFKFARCGLSVRRHKSKFTSCLAFPIRLIRDLLFFAGNLLVVRPSIVHVVAQYRSSAYREIFLLAIAGLACIPVVYDIRAGSFVSSYESSGWFYRLVIGLSVKCASAILVEGFSYMSFLEKSFGKESIYIPNFLSASWLPGKSICPSVSCDPLSGMVDLLFVGFFYSGKGARELLEACWIMVLKGFSIRLNVVGAIDSDIRNHDSFTRLLPGGHLVCHGVLNAEQIRAIIGKMFVYVYPTMHPGEGHNNSVNEAAACGLPLVLARHGFLPSVFDESEAFFLDKVTPDQIAASLVQIISDPEAALRRGEKARKKVENLCSSIAVSRRLGQVYGSLIRSRCLLPF